MAFNPEPQIQRTPTEIRTITVELFDGLYNDDSPDGKKYAHFEVRIDDQFGQPMNWRRGDLTNHLTPAQIQQLIDFMTMLRNKAESEILP
jgi:hypothetical protein